MTFIYELDLDIMEMYLYAKNEVPSSKYSKVIARTAGHTDRQTDRQTDRLTDREKHRGNWKETHREKKDIFEKFYYTARSR